ncbi:MAG: MMPL family transporter [Pseudomonadota bacterium]
MRDLSKDGNFSLYSVSSLVDDISALTETTATLNDIVSVDSVTNIHSLVPKDQSEKFLILDELNLVLGDNLAVADRGEFDSEALLEEVRALKTSLSRLEKNAMSDASASLLSSITKLLSMLDNLDPVTRSQRLELVDRNMMTSFKDRIERLSDGLNASEVTIDNLPEDVRRLWLSDRGKYRVEATPREDLSDNYALQAFVDEIREAVGDKATGTAVINVGAAQAVQAAFIQAFCYALGLISILLWLVLRSFKELLVTIFPLLLAGLITSGAIVLFELKLNFANVIALPLLLGIGVDSAIHLLHRYKTELEPTRSILQTSTARAVFFSAATTTVSFGNLALTDHAGTASMGIVLTIGIISVLFCMLIVLPAMMIAFVERANP